VLAGDDDLHQRASGRVLRDAGIAAAVPILVGLGVRELSVSPQAVPRVKAGLRELDVPTCVATAERALTLAGAADVRKLVLGMLSGTSS